tara:strand:- start:88 stop:246 length:159 start_codon:yes stop_codon:yes gene_type:complete
MTFEEYLSYMFAENCKERMQWGEKPFASVSDYYEDNHSFLVRKYREEYPNEN